MGKVAKRSILLAGHKASVSLEDEFWTALKHIAQEAGISVSALALRIDGSRERGNLSSALRIFVLDYYQSRAAANAQPAVAGTADDSRAAEATHSIS
jgi:predicted DNA-binding ribbon-helix-helix protein